MWYVPYYFIKISKNIVQRIDEISELKARLFQLVLVGFAIAKPTLRFACYLMALTPCLFDYSTKIFNSNKLCRSKIRASSLSRNILTVTLASGVNGRIIPPSNSK